MEGYHRELEKRTIAGLELLEKVTNEIIQAEKIDEILKTIVHGAINLTNADTGIIYLVDKKGQNVTHAFHPEGDNHPPPRLNDENGITRQVIRRKKTLAIPSLKKHPHVNPNLKKDYQSMFAVPLIVDEEVVGVLFQNYKKKYNLDNILEKFLSVLANLGAVMIKTKDQDKLYKSMLDVLPQRVFRKDLNSKYVAANPAFCESLGMKFEDIVGKNDFDVFENKEFAARYIEDDLKVIETKEPIEQIEWHQTKNMPNPIRVKVIKFPIFNTRNETIGVQVIYWDINEEILARERHRSLIEQSPDSILLHEKGKITMANPAAVELLKVENQEQLIGTNIVDHVHPKYRKLAKERLEKLKKNEKVAVKVEMQMIDSENNILDVEVYTKKPSEEDDVIQVVIHNLKDVKLLLAEMYHRVLNSLADVSWSLTFEGKDKPELKSIFEKTCHRIQAMSLVHQLLAESPAGDTVMFQTYLEKLSEAILTGYESFGKVSCEVNASDIWLNFKQARNCGLIVTELLSNSIVHAFGDDDGLAFIDMIEIADHFEIKFSDNGNGLPMEKISDLKKGMGLNLVKQFTEDLEGKMRMIIEDDDGFSVLIRFPKQLN